MAFLTVFSVFFTVINLEEQTDDRRESDAAQDCQADCYAEVTRGHDCDKAQQQEGLKSSRAGGIPDLDGALVVLFDVQLFQKLFIAKGTDVSD